MIAQRPIKSKREALSLIFLSNKPRKFKLFLTICLKKKKEFNISFPITNNEYKTTIRVQLLKQQSSILRSNHPHKNHSSSCTRKKTSKRKEMREEETTFAPALIEAELRRGKGDWWSRNGVSQPGKLASWQAAVGTRARSSRALTTKRKFNRSIRRFQRYRKCATLDN